MYGLIGKRLGHSFSADFFNEKFKKESIEESYELLPIPSIDDLPRLISKHPDLKGLNVTIPYKEEVIEFLDTLSEEANKIGAVNVIKIERKNSDFYLKGYNSDCIGFRDSLIPLLREDIRKALVLGTGGASKAVRYVLDSLGIESILVSRNPKNGQLSYHELTDEIIKNHPLIVNTTPLGMWPKIDEAPPIPYESLTPAHICYDLVYNPEETAFMKKAHANGAKVKNGLEMLHLQALAAWEIWNNE